MVVWQIRQINLVKKKNCEKKFSNSAWKWCVLGVSLGPACLLIFYIPSFADINQSRYPGHSDCLGFAVASAFVHAWWPVTCDKWRIEEEISDWPSSTSIRWQRFNLAFWTSIHSLSAALCQKANWTVTRSTYLPTFAIYWSIAIDILGTPAVKKKRSSNFLSSFAYPSV